MNKLFLSIVLVAALCDSFVSAQAQDDASLFCSTCSGRRNSKDHYAHPTDCHKYYQCFFHENGAVSGVERTCAPGTFFYERFLACGYEGPDKCQDVCLNETVQTQGYASVPGSCSQYIFCTTSSELMCCPKGTRFNANTGECDTDETCTDPCSQFSPAVPTSVAPPSFFNDTHCVDSFGNLLSAVPDRTDVFNVIDTANGDSIIQRPCATGSSFSLTECTCATPVDVDAATQPSSRQCSVYLPFDSDFADYSQLKIKTEAVGDVTVSNAFSAHGGSSALFNGGHVELLGTKSLDVQYSASYCLFYRCPNGTCPTGGLLSNNNNDQKTSYSSILASQGQNNIRALLKMLYPASEFDLSTAINATDGFNQICVVFDAPYSGVGNVLLYVNNQLVSTTANVGWINPAHCPYAVGADQTYGNFNGYIDEVLICPYAINAAAVDAHFNGQTEMRDAQLIP